ncbi:transglutaminase-like domain-containing protein [Olivibacter sp. CPCC 100613]|uniref:transglutaminase-like domain-containing protein n=1 Tax=Olivibacter sp. CPCC 100613 TaxID=3079931 RepID=UPI002FF8CF7C
MLNDKEINSLIHLLDDPDDGVFRHVEEKLLTLGTAVIAPLEAVWEKSFDSFLQSRIENLIHKIQFEQVYNELELWYMGGGFDLLQGLIIVNKYQYPDLEDQSIINQVEEIKRDAWLEMMYNMSAVEKVRLLNNVFYNMHGFKGNTKNYHDPQNSYIGKVLETRRGNPILLAALYSIVAQRLDIPIYGVNLPRHFILAYMDEQIKADDTGVLFYINAFNRGQIFGKHDVLSFLKQLNLPSNEQFFLPCDNLAIVSRVLRNLLASYNQAGSLEKADEVQRLLHIFA